MPIRQKVTPTSDDLSNQQAYQFLVLLFVKVESKLSLLKRHASILPMKQQTKQETNIIYLSSLFSLPLDGKQGIQATCSSTGQKAQELGLLSISELSSYISHEKQRKTKMSTFNWA